MDEAGAAAVPPVDGRPGSKLEPSLHGPVLVGLEAAATEDGPRLIFTVDVLDAASSL